MDWLLAYGSLLPAAGQRAARRRGAREPGRVAALVGGGDGQQRRPPGYKHYVTADGRRPAVMVCYLDIAEHPGGVVNGVALAVGARSCRRSMPASATTSAATSRGELDVALDGRVWAYARSPTARTSASRPAGSAPAPRSPTSAATSARAFTAASVRADLRFVNLARWSSPLMFSARPQRPEFREAGAALPFRRAPGALQRRRRLTLAAARATRENGSA